GYGCNMTVRLSVIHAHGIRFDEDLPLYAWLEDVDLSRRMAPYGRIVGSATMRGVHLGSKRGRSSGIR
uniref:glycosyltransferase family 2 protein n=1 Tax=Escherichia coli TaxID=562 RepID=UPI00195349D0